MSGILRVKDWARFQPQTEGLVYSTLKQDQVGMRRLRQGVGHCELCGCDGSDQLVMDHNHKTGLTRGIVCRSCNRAIDLTERARSCSYGPIGLGVWLRRGLVAA